MFFKTASRIDPQTREMSIYYHLVENYRNVLGDTRQRTILTIGRMVTEEETALALSHIVSRAVYPASELKTVSFMQENSSICELMGLSAAAITKDRLYRISHKLYGIKDSLEKYLSRKTNELFDLEDKIILYDLTNTYFEGEKRQSQKAKHGRSKEKRTDCPLFVLALVVNVEGFVKYSSIYEGNYLDSSSMENILNKLQESTGNSNRRVVVIDAGIATGSNLAKIVEKSYDYVCVSRRNLKEYSSIEGQNPIYVKDRKRRKIALTEVETTHQGESEYYLKVTSEGK